MFCENCGNQLRPGAKFCGGCGNPVGGNSDSSTPARSQGVERPASRTAGRPSAVRGEIPKRSRGGHGPVRPSISVRPGFGFNPMLMIPAALAIIALVVVLVIVKPFSSSKPEDTIAKLEKAMNKLDMEEMLECFDETTQDLYSGTLSVVDSFTDYDIGGMMDLASGLGSIFGGTDMMPKYSISIVELVYSSPDSCTVTANMQVSYQGTVYDSQTSVFPMVKEGRKWVISAEADINSLLSHMS